MRVESFPRVVPALSDEEKQKLPQSARFAELWGCPSNLLYLCEPAYLNSGAFKIHNFKDLQVRHLNDKLETFKASDQMTYAMDAVYDLHVKSGELTVINAYPNLKEGTLLLWHLLANLAALKAKDAFKFRNIGVTFAGNTKLLDAQYNTSSILVIGPVLDEFGPERTVNLVETIYRFQHLNRILLLSTLNVPDFLVRARVAPSDVARFFNVSAKNPEGLKKKRRSKTEAQEV